MLKQVLTAVFSLLLFAGSGCAHDPGKDEQKNIQEAMKMEYPAPKTYPKLVWHDEFDQKEINPEKWTRIVISDKESEKAPPWQRYTSSRPDLAVIKDGCLVLRGINNPDRTTDSRPFLQGQVFSQGKFSFQYGKIEIRAKFEDQQGAWPAFWLLPEKGQWPYGGEIDIMERVSDDPFIYQTCHSAWTFLKKQNQNPPNGGKADFLRNEFNVYGLEWTENELIWSVNGKDTFRYPRTDADPTQWPYNDSPFYILLDMQLGAEWIADIKAETLPVSVYIDWVRVWQKN